ncbi:MAG: sulfite exporter TauE/SafE family protein [Actinobacteria bacterium]|nr:sulfite exporter TauE/SafE family protein [Actinomycetota bacterium]
MHILGIDPGIVAAGLLAGFTVGLTGMGGGAITTPLLILVFRVPAVAAVGTDLTAGVVMKLVGGGVHAKAGTVRWDLVRRLSMASVPATVLGVMAIQFVGEAHVEGFVQRAVGVALLAGAGAMLLRSRRVRRALGLKPPETTLAVGEGETSLAAVRTDLRNPAALTLALGALVGFMVGLTSVGSGSLMIAALTWLYPRLHSSELVGTDLAQAFLLVTAAAIAHMAVGHVDFGLAGSLLVGAVPGVIAGARLSSRAPDHIVRPALVTVLAATGLKLL